MVLTIKRLSLTAFFIVLTFSIGLVSVNLPLTVKAQNNALSQSGNGDSEQVTKQFQSSEQNGQVISGDSSMLSGNNLLCENEENSEDMQTLTGLCNLGETNSPPSNNVTVRINAHVLGDACTVLCALYIFYDHRNPPVRQIIHDSGTFEYPYVHVG